jgi:glycosyltransferase involved in cell wall biosynthesis
MTRFSICIPNYNYAHYLGPTIESVLGQKFGDLEVVVSDNASTDASVEVIESYGDPRISVTVNRANVGFSGNLDRAAARATGEVLVMLSSDDLMHADALDVYDQLFAARGDEPIVVTAGCDLIDSEGTPGQPIRPDPLVWKDAPRDEELSRRFDAPVLRLPATEVLRRSLTTMRNPFPFLATAYPRTAYEAVEGYRGSRLMNPDKWFHWRLMSAVEHAYFVDRPLFSYRWHATNQTAIQSTEGALKVLVDDYTSTFEADAALLERGGVSRDELVAAFVEYDIGRHGLATLARGDRRQAQRILRFGRACYPTAARRNRKVGALAGLLALGPLGSAVAARAYQRSDDRRTHAADRLAPAQ